jgi:hypothetical protein
MGGHSKRSCSSSVIFEPPPLELPTITWGSTDDIPWFYLIFPQDMDVTSEPQIGDFVITFDGDPPDEPLYIIGYTNLVKFNIDGNAQQGSEYDWKVIYTPGTNKFKTLTNRTYPAMTFEGHHLA